MRSLIFYIVLIPYMLITVIPVEGRDSRLQSIITRAMQEEVLLEVRISEKDRMIGRVVEIGDDGFTMLNPLSARESVILWKSVLATKQAKTLTPESRSKLDSLSRKAAAVRFELLDGTELKGRVVRTGEDDFTIRISGSQSETRIEYGQVLTLDDEPVGQKVIRSTMIGVGVGLGTLLAIAIALFSD